MKFIQSTLFASLLGMLLFLGTSAMLTIKGAASIPTHEAEEEHGPAADTKGPSWSFFNPEMDQIIADLKAEKAAIANKEKQLAELSSRVTAEKAELDEALRTVKRMQDQVDRNVIQIKDDEVSNLKRLAKMYSTMEPSGAARILKEIDDSVVVKVLTLMKEPETAAILDTLAKMGETETKRAATISETLRIAAGNKGATKP